MIKKVKQCGHYFMYDMKMRHKITLIFALFTIIPFLLFSVITGGNVARRLNESEIKVFKSNLEQSKELLISELYKIREMVSTFYLDESMYHYLSSSDEKAGKYNSFLIEEKLATIAQNKDISEANLFLADDEKLPQPHFRTQKILGGRSAAWYSDFKKAGKPLWKVTSTNVYYISPIYNKYNVKEFVGCIVITFSRDLVKNILKNLSITENSMAFIMSEEGEILFSVQKDDKDIQTALNSSIDINKKGLSAADNIRSFGALNKEYVLLNSGIGDRQHPGIPSWTLNVLIPYNECAPFVRDFLFSLCICAILCASVLSVVIGKIIGSITKRIDKLNENMERFQRGDFSSNEYPVGSDEISELRENFNYMLERIELLMNEKILASEREKNMELIMLQSQINPHFLYNTLDMINWAAMSRKPEIIPEITQTLAKFYKLSLNRGARIVTLKDELEHVRLYIKIQNMRFDSALTLNIQIHDEILNCACCKVVLQPIVENAILHGIFEKEDPSGTVIIKGYRREQDVYIDIIDDGVGMEPEYLNNLRNQINNHEAKGYGLVNIMERLQICYGPEYGLSFESVKGKYTKVTVKIRYQQYEDSIRTYTSIRGQN